jgi:hypothetical protein
VLALLGGVVTLRFQARETKLAREEARRQAISDLLKMAMDDPDLDECWGPVPPPADAKIRKQQLYTNMIVSEWATSFETKALREPRLRHIANEIGRIAARQRFLWAGIGAGALALLYRLLRLPYRRHAR